MIRTASSLALLAALAAVPARAAAPAPPVQAPISQIVADPQHYLGDRIETEGYVIDKSGLSAQMGGTNQGMVDSQTLVVAGPQTRALNYFDRFRLLGVLQQSAEAHANGSRYELDLSGKPVPVGN